MKCKIRKEFMQILCHIENRQLYVIGFLQGGREGGVFLILTGSGFREGADDLHRFILTD